MIKMDFRPEIRFVMLLEYCIWNSYSNFKGGVIHAYVVSTHWCCRLCQAFGAVLTKTPLPCILN